MEKRTVLCKFFAQGACLKGDHCDFSHDWNAKPNNVCAFFQRGACSFGSRCRYVHVKVSSQRNPASSTSSPSNVADEVDSDLDQLIRPFNSSGIFEQTSRDLSESSTLGKSLMADQPICSFAVSGRCSFGENCSRIHGDVCSFCGKMCLHPYRPDEAEEHVKSCHMKRLKNLKLSEEIECSVCFERVFSKPTSAERKFGLLPECDHPFCITCIRNWRNNAPLSGVDVNAAARTCPVCRKLSYFVIPSFSWFSTREEKQEIIANYKDKLKSIDCKYFDFGNGTCPFGTSCFYKHKFEREKIRPRTSRSSRPPRGRRSVSSGEPPETESLFVDVDLNELAEHLLAHETLEQFMIRDELDDVGSSLGFAFLLMQLSGIARGGRRDSSSGDEI